MSNGACDSVPRTRRFASKTIAQPGARWRSIIEYARAAGVSQPCISTVKRGFGDASLAMARRTQRNLSRTNGRKVQPAPKGTILFPMLFKIRRGLYPNSMVFQLTLWNPAAQTSSRIETHGTAPFLFLFEVTATILIFRNTCRAVFQLLPFLEYWIRIIADF